MFYRFNQGLFVVLCALCALAMATCIGWTAWYAFEGGINLFLCNVDSSLKAFYKASGGIPAALIAWKCLAFFIGRTDAATWAPPAGLAAVACTILGSYYAPTMLLVVVALVSGVIAVAALPYKLTTLKLIGIALVEVLKTFERALISNLETAVDTVSLVSKIVAAFGVASYRGFVVTLRFFKILPDQPVVEVLELPEGVISLDSHRPQVEAAA